MEFCIFKLSYTRTLAFAFVVFLVFWNFLSFLIVFFMFHRLSYAVAVYCTTVLLLSSIFCCLDAFYVRTLFFLVVCVFLLLSTVFAARCYA